jgi:outer membrane protein assembly factor BamA
MFVSRLGDTMVNVILDRLAAWLFFFFAAGTVFAQTDSSMLAAKEDSGQSSSGFVGAPFAKYEPETGIAGGVVGLYYFRIHNDSGAENRSSDISAGGTYTQKNQLSFGVDYSLNFGNNGYFIFGGLDYKRIPFDFFGIGNNNSKNPIDNYTPLWRGGDVLMTRSILKTDTGLGLSAGLGADIRTNKILTSNQGGIIQTGSVPGSKGGVTSGLGWIVTYDTRDNAFSAQSGYYLDLRTFYYGKAIGSDFNFNRTTIDIRKFIPALPNQTFAVQGLLTVATGNEPFYMMSELGGEVNMRGYFEGRFRDRDMAVLQAEYRVPVIWRFGVVGFADIGEVSSTVHDFVISGLKYTFGAGIRLFVSQSERVVARLDYGIGKDSQELYFSVLEAF